MKVITLGNCCKNSQKNHENVAKACKICGVEEPQNIGDMMEIMKMGVMMTPAVIIDNKVVSSGKVLTVEQAEKLIRDKM